MKQIRVGVIAVSEIDVVSFATLWDVSDGEERIEKFISGNPENLDKVGAPSQLNLAQEILGMEIQMQKNANPGVSVVPLENWRNAFESAD